MKYLHLISLFDLCINNGPAVGCVEGSPSKSIKELHENKFKNR